MSTFREFQAGFAAGQDMRKTRERDQAQARASALFGAGDYDGAEAAMYGAGMFAEGSALAGAGERRTAKAREKTYGDAFRTGGYKAVREAAGAEGDIGFAADLDRVISAMSAEDREAAALRAQFFADASYGLVQIQDPEQRKAALMEIVQTSGDAFGITPEQAAAFDLSDANLKQTYESSLSVAERLGMQRQDARWAVEDDRAERTLGMQERGVAIAEEELALKRKLAAAPPPDLSSENSMRAQYLGQVKSYGEIRDAYARVLSTQDTPAGDVALVYGIMKMIDPGAAVMEGDIANASNTTGVPGVVMNIYNGLVNGGKLNDTQRAEFLSQAAGLYDAAEIGYGATLEMWREMAMSAGFDPLRVAPDQRVIDFSGVKAPNVGGRGGGGNRPSLDDIFGDSAPEPFGGGY